MDTNKLVLSDGLVRLIRANEPYWGAEAEVIRSYWTSPVRNRESDQKWLVHQIYKEYWDGILPPLEIFRQRLPQAGARAGRQSLLAIAEVLYEEVEHFTLFADLYCELLGSDYGMTPEALKEAGSWAENDALMTLRAGHISESAVLGQRAFNFSEGGHCALFTEGMALSGGSDSDNAIARVCREIYDDEFNHMLLGILENDDSSLSASDWDTLTSFTVAQMKARIVMRNAQFSHPVSDKRMQELLNGAARPVVFDMEKALNLMRQGSQ